MSMILIMNQLFGSNSERPSSIRAVVWEDLEERLESLGLSQLQEKTLQQWQGKTREMRAHRMEPRLPTKKFGFTLKIFQNKF